MLEKKSILTIVALLALTFVIMPSAMFHSALTKYLSFMGHWSVASIKPSRNAQIPPMHPRAAGRRADLTQPELRFVRFTVKISGAKIVRLSGDFNNWNPDALPLTRRDKNVWGAVIPLPPGMYLYLYDIDGRSILDPLNPDTAMLAGKKVSVRTVK
jgi:hypothetical protein